MQSEKAIYQGLENVELSGRFQLVDGDIPVLLDVGHNPQAVRTLLEYLQQYFPAVKIHAVFSMMQDKDIRGVIKIIKPVIYDWTVAPLNNPRTASDETIIKSFTDNDIDNVSIGFADFSEAFLTAKNKAMKGDLMLVFGSFFLVSEYLACRLKRGC